MKKSLRFASACLLGTVLVSCNRKSETEPGAKVAHEKYSLEWVSNDIPATMTAGKATAVHISVKNTGNWPWLNAAAANPPKPDGSYAVRLSYRWASADGKLLPQGNERGELNATVPPGDTANFSVEVLSPRQAGSYRLEVDLVEELVAFFSAKGSQKLTVPVTVQ
jgi:uncharacterized membrane protein